ncbi:MAG TPA: hypothetical protein VNM38_01950 [Solirubrobacterales bacterium]|nr:hypothetical protein [Solirubrobacterales bacterium]
MVKDQRHRSASPIFVLTTHLAAPFFDPLGEETTLQSIALIRRVLTSTSLNGVGFTEGLFRADAPPSK